MTNPTKVCPLTDEQKKAAREEWLQHTTIAKMFVSPEASAEARAAIFAVYAAGLRDAAPAEAAQGEVGRTVQALTQLASRLRNYVAERNEQRDEMARDVDTAIALLRALAPKAAQDLTADDQAMMQRALHRSAERIAPKTAQDKGNQ